MNNPGIDFEIWEKLRKKWTVLDTTGHKLKVEFKIIYDAEDKTKVLAIDVIQHIDDDLITETVQRNAGEAYSALGIAGLSMERLIGLYKDMMKLLHRQTNQYNADLIVTMSPTSSTSGEVQAYLKMPDDSVKTSVLANYSHYYILNALRDRMIDLLGDTWVQTKATYHKGDVDFYFEYS